jgi:hypothetical protein
MKQNVNEESFQTPHSVKIRENCDLAAVDLTALKDSFNRQIFTVVTYKNINRTGVADT